MTTVADPKDPNEIQRRYREFLDLMPLTLALAGLPHSDSGRYVSVEQIELRAGVIRNAFSAARSLAKEIVTR